MITGLVFGLVAAVVLVAAFPLGLSRSVGRRIPAQRRTIIFGLAYGVGFAMVFQSAQDMRGDLGFWTAYGATYGPVFLALVIGALIVRRDRVEADVPQPLWKWTQRN